MPKSWNVSLKDYLASNGTVSMLPPDASRAYWTLVRCAIGLFFHPPDAVLDQSPICAIRERHAR